MNAKVIFLLFAVFACVVLGQGREDKLTIDPFVPETATIIILIESTDLLPIQDERFTQDAGILGGERDLSLTAESGNANLVLTTGVTGGLWSVSTPNSARGFALMQYDGLDASLGLRENGLGEVNLVVNSADAFHLRIQSDIVTEYTFTVYSPGGASSSFALSIPGDDTTNEYFVEFDSFTGNADFSRVGAMEILIEAFDNVDTFVEFFATSGPVVSPTPTPTPFPDVPSPSPIVPGGFTWYTFDDDDNGRSPCGDEEPRRTYFVKDDNIIYYYFYGLEEPQVLDSSSSASMIQITSALLAAVVAFFAL